MMDVLSVVGIRLQHEFAMTAEDDHDIPFSTAPAFNIIPTSQLPHAVCAK
jgi:hypothetical protein